MSPQHKQSIHFSEIGVYNMIHSCNRWGEVGGGDLVRGTPSALAGGWRVGHSVIPLGWPVGALWGCLGLGRLHCFPWISPILFLYQEQWDVSANQYTDIACEIIEIYIEMYTQFYFKHLLLNIWTGGGVMLYCYFLYINWNVKLQIFVIY